MNRTFWVAFLSLAMSPGRCHAERRVSALDLSLAQDQTNCLSVLLEAVGDENALSFSLCFDTNLLTFTSARRGSDAAGASWNVNTNQAPSGRLGFFLALPFGEAFPGGSNDIVEVCFRASAQPTTITTAVSLCDAPLGREVVDGDGGTLATVYADATVTVLGTCLAQLGTSEEFFQASGGTGVIDLRIGAQCAWTVVNESSWIAFTSPTNGTGSNSVRYAVEPNPLAVSRTALLSLGGETFTVIQSGAPCTYALDPTNRWHSYLSEAALVSVTTQNDCAWNVVNTNDWIVIKLATNGVGSGTVRYTVFANPNPEERSGVITIGGEPFQVNQIAGPCTYTLLPLDRLVGPESVSGSVTVFTAADCDWTVSNTSRWITITSSTNGAGYGVVDYTVAPSLSPNDRTAVVTIGDQNFTVTQLASPCWYALSPTNRALGFGAAAGTVTVTANAHCTSFGWSVSNPNDWISITSMSNSVSRGSLTYAVAANTRTIARTGAVMIADQPFIISQAGAPCTYALSPTNRVHAYQSETALVSLTTLEGCSWTVRNTNVWITMLSPTGGLGSGTISYLVLDNPGPARSGTLQIGGATFAVRQEGPQAPALTNQPISQNVVGGATVVFSVGATGSTPLSYRWRCNGTNIFDGPGVNGAVTARLSLSNVQPTQAGNYDVVVSNVRGSVTSAPPAVLRVNTPPTLAPIPSKLVNAGSRLSFTASATDADVPKQTLSYSLDAGAPAGASIDPSRGWFSWTAGAAPETSTNWVTIRVVDNGLPPLSDAQTVTILVVAGFSTNVSLVATGSVWRYRDTGEDLGTDWSGLAFDDRAWPGGPAKLGYGNGDEATVVSYGPDASAKFITTYFRSSFRVSNPALFGELGLRVRRDDGVVVYLNGREVYRDNMPDGVINYLTPAAASASDDGTIYFVGPPLDASYLVAGDNVVAAEIHQRSGSSSDIAFDLELTGTENTVLPIVTAQPQSQSAMKGESVAFRVEAVGARPLSYQWHFNSSTVPQATNETLILSAVQPFQAGSYFVVITNFLGAATSAVATLTVQTNANTAPVLAAIGNKLVTEGSVLAFTARATDADLPKQTLTYSLDPGALAGAAIHPATGLFTWTPGATGAAGTNRLTIRATDNGSPPLSAAQTVTITVLPGFNSSNVTLVATGSVWRYRDTGEDLGTEWTGLAFDDRSWASGAAKLGYGDANDTTVLSYGPDSSAKFITTYFRCAFSLADAAIIGELGLHVLRDDGVVVYLNGREVYRDNMPPGPIDYLTPAASTAADDGTVYFLSPPVDAGYLVAGDNVVAAEIHQRSGSSSDIAFDLELTGTQRSVAASGPPEIRLMLDHTSGVSLRCNASPGSIYRAQYTDDLAAPAWADLQDDVLATNSVVTATDSMAAVGQRFYRILRVD